ncbi:MAG TPA: hypothetical protein VN721_16130 [Flavipsychrobacter sp.]|nr:hypothetical protein [Flavipsychrobacter sp.]
MISWIEEVIGETLHSTAHAQWPYVPFRVTTIVGKPFLSNPCHLLYDCGATKSILNKNFKGMAEIKIAIPFGL